MGSVTLFSFVIKRVSSRWGMTLLLVLTLAVAVAVVAAVPIFSNAVALRVMELETVERTNLVKRPVLSLQIIARPASGDSVVGLGEASRYGEWLADRLERMGLPIAVSYQESSGVTAHLSPREDDARYDRDLLATVEVAHVPGIGERIEVVSGQEYGSTAADGVLEVWVHRTLADQLAVSPGETFDLVRRHASTEKKKPVRVAGIFEAVDLHDPFWPNYPTHLFRGTLITTAEIYQAHIHPWTPLGTTLDEWYFVLDEAEVNLQRASAYAEGLRRLEMDVSQRLPGGRIDHSPLEALLDAQQRRTALATILLSFVTPLMVILLYFVASLSSIMARAQAREMAILASRGSSRSQVLSLILLQNLLMLLAATPLGVALGLGLARVLSLSDGFLRFTTRPPLAVHPASMSLPLLGGTLVASLLAASIPAWLASRHSVVTHEQESSRELRGERGMRLLLLVVLCAASLYAYQRLGDLGTLARVSWSPEDAGHDPLLLLAPTLFVLSTPLVLVELFALLTRLTAPLARLLPWTAGYVGVTNVGRETRLYRAPAYLLIVCLGLGVFYASLAKSADVWLTERLRYQAGADLTFGLEDASAGGGGGSLPAGSTGSGGAASAVWMLPMSEYEGIEGVERATSVGRFEAIAPSAEGATKLPLLTVDRLSFPDVAYFRSDFSSSSLGDLMNQLGREPKNALVSTELAQALQLVRGDTFVLNITVPGGMLRNVEFVYAAGLEYFPQMGDPGPLVVANRGYLADLMGGLVPGAIWLRLEPGAQVDDILTWVRRRGLEPVDVANLPEMLSEDQARLERVGIYGTLSICFLAGALLSVAAFVIYCALSLNKRAPRLAILQALGMTKLEVSGVVWIEYLIVSLFGVLAGIGLGVLTSRLYVPFFPLAEGDALPVPPFVPHIDWSRADWMSSGMLLVLVAVQAAVFGYLAKSRVFETLRMGARE